MAPDKQGPAGTCVPTRIDIGIAYIREAAARLLVNLRGVQRTKPEINISVILPPPIVKSIVQ